MRSAHVAASLPRQSGFLKGENQRFLEKKKIICSAGPPCSRRKNIFEKVDFYKSLRQIVLRRPRIAFFFGSYSTVCCLIVCRKYELWVYLMADSDGSGTQISRKMGLRHRFSKFPLRKMIKYGKNWAINEDASRFRLAFQPMVLNVPKTQF